VCSVSESILGTCDAPGEIEAIRATLTARAFEQEIAACSIDEVSGAL
jgi:hypothetical protein